MDAEQGPGSPARIQREDSSDGFCAAVLTFLSMFFVLITLPISIWMVVKQVQVRPLGNSFSSSGLH